MAYLRLRRCIRWLVAVVSLTALSPHSFGQAKLGAPIDVAKQAPARLPAPVKATPLPATTVMPMLRLNDVVAMADRQYPLLFAIRQTTGIEEGKYLSSLGAFDLKLNGHDWINGGSFASHRFRLGLDQALGYQGIRLYGGYRNGRGNFPSYYGDRLTAQGGEIFAGMRLPMLRDRDIDLARANRTVRRLGVDLTNPEIARNRLAFLQDAARKYWSWVAARQRLAIAKQLLDIAEKRDAFLRKQLKAGAIPKIEITDNQRTVFDRRTRLMAFRRAFEQASIALSLYVRTEQGQPVRPDRTWSAGNFPPPLRANPKLVKIDADFALSNRPEMHSFEVRRRQLQVKLNLANNQTLPNFDFVVQGAQDMGAGKTSLDRERYELGALLEVPLQRRLARGKILTTQAELAKLSAENTFLRDKIIAEVQDAMSALIRSYQLYTLASQTVAVNRQMENAELRKYELGKSNLIFVNLRELARAEAQFQTVDALLRFHHSVAAYRSALGLPPTANRFPSMDVVPIPPPKR